ncbi:hypothetical protein SAMN05216317_10677 [Nitrosomonas eutropha]|uniref:hypothetical protein n=1 Tax=Nitrosomonas TaxID=914 RepID=UPI00089118E0|nr:MULTISPECIES: hypothetical protein [Nitrosomonas]MXS79795.1 hypothetical protein [Nitrosomonas sp. GH22]SCX05033.1 hypothetical protein SAMN05216379_10377 [Nitrosomonas eutropha]SDW47162.1 hypothetical protein SAMN05216317_10677 [Nitrosomonas eutropha]
MHSKTNKVTQQQLDYILQSAILAPSADNQHQARFKITGNSIHIYHTRTEFPSEGGYKWVLALLSLGAITENIVLAASHFNFHAEAMSFPEPSNPHLILQITLHADQTEEDSLREMIPLRHTNRRLHFLGPGMTDIEREVLHQTIQKYSDCKLHWLDTPALRKQTAYLMRIAETERFRNPLLHEELFSAIRFDIGWHTTCTEGLPPGALGIEPLSRGFFSLLRHWPIAQLANSFGMHHVLGFRSSYLPCRLAPHLGALSVKKIDTQSILQAGRSFQRLWLTLTKQGRVLQPMPASAIYALPQAINEGIPATLQQKLLAGWKTIFPENIPVILFRMGNASHLPIITSRPEITSLVEHS